MFSVRHRSAVINWRFCLTRPAFPTEGMLKIAREFNFGETTFVLQKNDPANTCRVRIFTPRVEAPDNSVP
jgi:predicted PhzF superfamily epimerase YddE/YHI9